MLDAPLVWGRAYQSSAWWAFSKLTNSLSIVTWVTLLCVRRRFKQGQTLFFVEHRDGGQRLVNERRYDFTYKRSRAVTLEERVTTSRRDLVKIRWKKSGICLTLLESLWLLIMYRLSQWFVVRAVLKPHFRATLVSHFDPAHYYLFTIFLC